MSDQMAVSIIGPDIVAPLGAPDGKIDIVDVLMIMRNVVGSVSL